MLGAVFLVSWGLTTHGKYSVTGDEPHYLIVAQSLSADHDLDVGNNYAHGDGALFGAAGLQREMHARTARDGRLRPVHDVGLPIVLLPVYVIATRVATIAPEVTLARFRMNRGLFAYSLISLFIIGVVTGAAAATATALDRLGHPEWIVLIVVSVAWLSAPVLSNSFLIFPEAFALLVTALTIREWAGPNRQWTARDSAIVLALGALPWLHRKYALYAAALLVVFVWRKRHALASTGRAAVAGNLLLFIAPQLALMLWTYHYWGNFAGPLAIEGLPFSMAALRNGAAGLLVDRENGLLCWAPVYALLPAAWWLRRSHGAIWLLPVIALWLPSAAHDQWWGGFSPAGRFLVPLVPIFCFVGAILLERRVARWIAVILTIPQVLIAAYGWQHARLLWPRGDGHNSVLSAVLGFGGLDERWLPSFRTMPQGAWPVTLLLLLAVMALNLIVVVVSKETAMER